MEPNKPNQPTGPRRRKARVLAVGSLVLLGLVVVLIGLLVSRGPTYQGRSVKSWLKVAAVLPDFGGPEAKEAFRQFGAKAVPLEIEILRGENLKFDAWYQRTYPKLPDWIRRRLSRPVHPIQLQIAAWRALSANPATHDHLHDLLPLLEDHDHRIRVWAANLIEVNLRAEDSFCIPALIGALTNSTEEVRGLAARVLGIKPFGDKAKVAVPALLRAVEDTSPTVRIHAARSLFELDPSQNLKVVTVLYRGMMNDSPTIRLMSAKTCLETCDPSSKTALGVLISTASSREAVPPSQPPWRARQAEEVLVNCATQNTNLAIALEQRMLSDPDAEFREVCRKVLEKVRSPP